MLFRSDDMGLNDAGRAARALVFDFVNLGFNNQPTMDSHPKSTANLLFIDGHGITRTQTGVSLGFDASMTPAPNADFVAYTCTLFSVIVPRFDQLWVDADWAEGNDPQTCPSLP